jgi:hypothetical protein
MPSSAWISNQPQNSYWRIQNRFRRDSLEGSRRSLLRVLAMICQPNRSGAMPAAMILDLYSREESFGYRRLIRRLATRMEQGLSLPDALDQTPGLLADHQSLAIRLASQSGTLPEAIDQLIADRWLSEKPQNEKRTIQAYLIGMGVIFLLMLAFIRAVLTPTFSYLVAEFERNETWAFQLLTDPMGKPHHFVGSGNSDCLFCSPLGCW